MDDTRPAEVTVRTAFYTTFVASSARTAAKNRSESVRPTGEKIVLSAVT